MMHFLNLASDRLRLAFLWKSVPHDGGSVCSGDDFRTATLLFPQVSKATTAAADGIRVDQPDAHVCLWFTQPLPFQAGCTGTNAHRGDRGIHCRQTQSLRHWRCLLLTPSSCQTTALPICHHLPTGVFWNDAPRAPTLSPSAPRLPIKKKEEVLTNFSLFNDTSFSHVGLTCTELIYIGHTSSLHIALHFKCRFHRCHTKKDFCTSGRQGALCTSFVKIPVLV